ncbi:MAG: putative oligopeptide transporter (OPT) family protein [Planctomycetaceae bacterium]|jgi:uncharacterized oligopeptide transporter (OPT) family protein
MADTNNGDDNLSPGSIAGAVARPYRELTLAAVLLGIAQGITLNLAFVYVALKLGFGIGGSTVAAIMGYALLRGVLRTGTMVENNINQTIASGINTAGSGIVFTVPALYLIDPNLVHFLPLSIAGIAGAVLGVVVIIPLRKQMIEMDRLRFPSGVATATIIRAGSSGAEKAKLLAIGVVISAAFKCFMIAEVLEPSVVVSLTAVELAEITTEAQRIVADEADPAPGESALSVADVENRLKKQKLHSRTAEERQKLVAKRGWGVLGEEFSFDFGKIPTYCSPVIYLSLMNIAAGLLAGRGGLPFFAGGLLAWWVISPIAVHNGWMPTGAPEEAYPGILYGKMLRPLGIGTLIGGALMGVVMAFPAIKSAFRSLAAATKTSSSGSKIGSDELTLVPLVGGLIVGVTLLFIASMLSPGVSVGQAVMSAVVGTVWAGLAALIVAQASGMTDIQPMSGMSLISVTLMLVLLGGNAPGAMVVGVAVCVAIGQGADMMQDLKTGFLVGARPIKQQMVQFGVTWMGALLALWAVDLLWHAQASPAKDSTVAVASENGEAENAADGNAAIAKPTTGGGFGPDSKLPAPQGAALAEIIKSISGEMNPDADSSSKNKQSAIPVDKYAMGTVVGVLLGAAPMAGLGVLVGLAMYLPFSITLGYGCGCLLQMMIQKVKGASFCENRLVPLAAGLIVGEALTGMGHAMYSVLFPT